MNAYRVEYASVTPELQGGWNSITWQKAAVMEIDQFRPESSAHWPRTQARLLYNATHLYGIFQVQDYYVRSVHTAFQDSTYQDSCVECFIQPDVGGGYFNFEFNAGGTLAVFYIRDWTRTDDGFASYTKLSWAEGAQVKIWHSLPDVIEPERVGPLTWTLAFGIPFGILAGYTGFPQDLAGQTWQGNLFKCGDQTSHPHWASWSPVDELNFHLPRCFGELHFAAHGLT
jgi:hypothetical protein